MLEALPAVTVPSGPKAGFRPAQLRLVELARALVLADRRGLAPDRDRHRHDLVGEDLVVDRLAGPGVAADGEVVLLLPGEAELRGAPIGEARPWLVAVGVGQAVVDHRVDQLAVAHPIALAGLEQQVRGPAHALHAAGDDHLGVAQRGSSGRPASPPSSPRRRPG